MRSYRTILLFLMTLLILGGCSDANQSQDAQEKQSRVVRENVKSPRSFGQILQEGSGKYAGSRYDGHQMKTDLNQLEEKLSPLEVYQHLIYLLGEDYGPVIRKVDNFDTSYAVEKEPNEATQKQTRVHVAILLDLSGSMNAKVDGRSKMELAKAAIQRFVSSLPKNADVTLKVYGHKGTGHEDDKEESCQSTETVYPFSPYEEKRFNQALDRLQPAGWAPMGLALEKVGEDLLKRGKGEKLVYVVSDGMETCGGNPVEAAKKLHESNIRATVNVIGFNVDSHVQRSLLQVANSGGGEYATVQNERALRNYFDTENARLSLSWSESETDPLMDLDEQWAKKRETLMNLIGGGNSEMRERLRKENTRMHQALDHLQKQGIVSPDERNKIARWIDKRTALIDNYREKRFRELDTAIAQRRDELKNQVKQREEQMSETYD